MKNLKKLLAGQRTEILPDEKIKDNIKRELGIGTEQASLSYALGGERTAEINAHRRKNVFSLCAVALAVVLSFAILLPVLLNRDNSTYKSRFANKFTQITDADSFYAYGAASVGTLLSASFAQTGADTFSVSAYDSPTAYITNVARARQTDTTESPLSIRIDRYMSLVESLFNESKIESDVGSGVQGYEFGMTVSYTDLHGNIVSFRMLYNRVLIDAEQDGDETEENYSVEGVIFVGNKEYPVNGLYKTEHEDGETESELYFKAFTNTEKTSYLEVRRSTENETEDGETETEQEYVYSVCNEGSLVEQTTVKYESENGRLFLKITVRRGLETDVLKFHDDSETDERILKVTGNVEGKSVSCRIYILQNGYRYVFAYGSIFEDEENGVDGDD